MAIHRHQINFILIIAVFTPFLVLMIRSVDFIQFYNINMKQIDLKAFFSSLSYSSPASCKNPLSEMVNGSWTLRTTSEHERYKVERFLTMSRGRYFIPTNLARPDGVCGNTTFDFLRNMQHQALWFRPLCDPYGPAPCCYNNRCVFKTIEECKCDNCYDMRTPLNAELADWIPTNPDCRIKQFTTDEACELLTGAHVYYIGDSFLRMVYTVTVNLLTGNYIDSALKPNTPIGWRKYCSNWIQLLCYKYINYKVPVCGGKAHIEHVELLTGGHGPVLLKLLKHFRNISNSIFFVGIGIHGTYNEQSVLKNFLTPSIQYLQANSRVNTTWPKFVWVSPHAPGILKTPRVPGQSYSSVVRFNSFINDKLKRAGIPILDTFNMTKGIMSFDGAHYGFGVNMLKSQMILNYLRELRSTGQW